MNRLLLLSCLLTLLAGKTSRADDLVPGLIGTFYSFDTALSDFPKITPGMEPSVKVVASTVHFELPNLPFYKDVFLAKFCVVWTGKLRIPKDDRYVLFLESDDGSRLFLDGTEVISNGGIHGMTEKSAELILKAGDHDIRIDYFQNLYAAGCNLAWQLPNRPKEIIPESALFHKPEDMELRSSEPGLLGSYFLMRTNLVDFPEISPNAVAAFIHVDKRIDFELPNKPFPGTNLTDHFFVRWTGQIRIADPDDYELFLESDDGSRLFLDGKELIVNGGTHGMKTVSAMTKLSAGNHNLRIDYFQNGYGAGCNFTWQPHARPKELIPEGVLFH